MDAYVRVSMSKRLKAAAIAAAFLLSGFLCSCSDCDNSTPVERNGQLHVEGTSLINEHGDVVQLRGMSCCDINSCYEFFSDEVCDTLISEWGCTVIRLPVTVRSLDNGYIHFPEYYYEEVCEYADTLIAHGVYVIIDWYNYFDGDPNEYADEAENFFDRISARYGEYPNVIYEISNEPHVESFLSDSSREVDWEHDVKPYSERMISAIRRNDPDNLIIAGVPHRNQDLDVVSLDPLQGDNIMYALHFYAGSHGQELRDKIQTALDNGLPIFCTQWGVSLDTGDSGVFYDESREWIDYLNANNISWCNWSIGSRHTESSNVLRLYSDRFTMEQKLAGHWPDEMISDSGLFVRELIRS